MEPRRARRRRAAGHPAVPGPAGPEAAASPDGTEAPRQAAQPASTHGETRPDGDPAHGDPRAPGGETEAVGSAQPPADGPPGPARDDVPPLPTLPPALRGLTSRPGGHDAGPFAPESPPAVAPWGAPPLLRPGGRVRRGRVRRIRPRGVVVLAVLGLGTAVVAAAATSRLLRLLGGPRVATPVPTAPAAPSPRWSRLPSLGAGDAAASLGTDASGGLWIVAAQPGGSGWQLFQASATVAGGGWSVAPVPAAAPGVAIQTVGAGTVWIAAGSQELGFNETDQTFETYAGPPALAVASVSGFSVAVYDPAGAGGVPAGPPYVLVAPLGGTSTRRIALPGAGTPPAMPAADVLAGPSGDALVAAGHAVWSVSPGAGQADTWASLPAGSDPAALAWGSGILWTVEAAGGGGRVAGISASGGSVPAPPRSAPAPAAASGLCFAGGWLWWSTTKAVVAWDPASGRAAHFPLPAGVAGPALLQAGPDGSVWAAAGDRYASLAAPQG